ncbi:class I SAM-dependent methyltransferase [Candidatus Parcubacteria bacterium]|nr:MAG: class I SAM-dependent methyltransferase [Candidatus Parcubacteria bacterium]
MCAFDVSRLEDDVRWLRDDTTLFNDHNFVRRREAFALLDFVQSHPEFPQNLRREARQLQDELIALENNLFVDWRAILLSPANRSHLLTLLSPFTAYQSGRWGKPHYGYEDVDFLLDGVLTPPPHPSPIAHRERGMVRYQPTPASVIFELVERLTLSSQRRFCDLGSGLGKVALLVNLLSGVLCLGIEFDPALCAYARQRAADLGLDGVHFVNTDARHADFGESEVFYLFNPFGGRIFHHVMARLHEVASHRPITICSYGAATPVLSELPWLAPDALPVADEYCVAIFRSQIA